MSNKIQLIVNPNAGLGKGKKAWQIISDMLQKSGFEFKLIFSERRFHAIELTKELVGKGIRKIIVIGGDGSLNEVVNGIFSQNYCPTTDVTIGIIPVGTGNDWCRMFNVPSDYQGAIDVIKKMKTMTQDVGVVKYYQNEKQEKRYFINVAGTGFDALVNLKSDKQKELGKGGKLIYMKNIFSCLLSSKYIPTVLKIDDNIKKANVFSMSVGICKYNGGGMMQLPDAVPDDGLLDLTLIKDMSKLSVIRNVRNLYDGSFTKHSCVETHQAKKIIVETETPVFLETDGESLGISPFEFDIIPKSLTIITG